MTTIIPNTIIRASAGSGKTYKLSSRYIALLLDGKPAEEILASTFTVKAAGEILQRVLQRLSAAVLDKDKYTELCKSLRDDFGERIPVPNKEKLQSVTAELARNLHRVQVGTLDSFFHKIARSFGLELNLPPDWTMVEDDAYARLLQEAIRNVLKKDTGNASGKINGLLHQWHEEKSTLTITRELVELATKRLSLIREVQKNPAVWDNEILFTKESTDDEIERAVQTLERAEVPQTKTGTPNKNFVKTINKVCTLVRKEGNECWKEFLESSTLIQAVADRTGKYYDKDIPDELDSAVSRLIEQARAALLNKLVRKTRAARELLTLIAQEYDALLYPSGAFRYEDITEKVCRASVDDMISVQMMAHRLDSDLGYLLLDEFQDTSLPQWKIIKPFAIEAKKSGSVFVVGDVKQAIYAWRGGVAEIFDKVEEELEPFDTQELAKSYRSAQPVIDTVNTVFEKIEDNLLFEDETKD
ncbi:MAG: UvrD-helicase domain-containing protein, partial [Planctomycetaceae bacterium]|nr:UvrD-helicase domain-containing protein [Planctomycetaceae bacterium]